MLHYRRFGSGRTVVLQHGFAGGSELFAPLSAHLAPNFDVITTDLPGFAGSADEPVPDSIEGLAEALVETIVGLGVDRFALLGHSLGAITALQAALDYPERIDKLILYGGLASGHVPDRFETYEETIARIEAEGIEKAVARLAVRWFVDGGEHPLYAFDVAAGAGLSQESAIRCLRAVSKWDVQEWLAEIHVPTLVICGDSDRATHPDFSVALWHGIANAQLCILPRCGHNAHLEALEIFNPVVARFLSDRAP